MKKILVVLVMIVPLFALGCAATGLYAVYKNPASGDILLVYADGTTKRMPILEDGAVLTGIIEYWQKNSGGLTPSPLALVKVNPDGTFKIKWVKGGPGLTDKVLDVIGSAVEGSVGAAIGGAGAHGQGNEAHDHGSGSNGNHDDGDHNDNGDGHENNGEDGHGHAE